MKFIRGFTKRVVPQELRDTFIVPNRRQNVIDVGGWIDNERSNTRVMIVIEPKDFERLRRALDSMGKALVP